ncbi:MAG: T9SS type A sorting domain-containing protein [Bacteroidetes bacterium]|nr:T9SS type A sorting domain-containing protein [Bacteroidota bacterium]
MIRITSYKKWLYVWLCMFPLFAFSQYNGGMADGAHTDALTQSSCSVPSQFFAYTGGMADGAHTDALVQASCSSPPQFFAYMGGMADGAHTDLLTNATCSTPPQYFAYMGGAADGAVTDVQNNSSCGTPPQFYAYMGSSGDGFSLDKVIYCTTLTPVADFTVNANTICAGSTVVFTDVSQNNPSNWNWIFTAGTPSVSTVATPTVNYNIPGVYDVTLTATNYNGSNTVVKTGYIVVNAVPTVTVSSAAICSGSTYTMVPGGASTYTYSSGTSVVTPTTTSSYTITGANAAGCTNTVVTTVTVNPNPVISANSGTICAGNTYTISPSGANVYSYTPSGPIVNPMATTTYTVVGTDGNNCQGIDTISIVVNPIPSVMAAISNSTICASHADTLIATGAISYIWSTNAGSATSSSVAISPMLSDTYTVLGTDINGCVGQSTVNVTVNALPSVTAVASNGTICTAQADTLTASGANTYIWSANAGSVTSATVVVTPTLSATYTVIGTNTVSGCSNQNTVNVTVTTCLGISEYEARNVEFAVYPNPNNGAFYAVVTMPQTTNVTFTIVNTLGQTIYNQIKKNVSNTIFDCNLEGIAPGVYYAYIADNEGNKIIKKIIKKIIIE